MTTEYMGVPVADGFGPTPGPGGRMATPDELSRTPTVELEDRCP